MSYDAISSNARDASQQDALYKTTISNGYYCGGNGVEKRQKAFEVTVEPSSALELTRERQRSEVCRGERERERERKREGEGGPESHKHRAVASGGRVCSTGAG
eukprot:scaffold296903_cov27-Tisochrysis_lutea.AAC.3